MHHYSLTITCVASRRKTGKTGRESGLGGIRSGCAVVSLSQTKLTTTGQPRSDIKMYVRQNRTLLDQSSAKERVNVRHLKVSKFTAINN